MLTQHYKLIASPEHITLAKPGQAVFDEVDQDVIIGFIDIVSDASVSVMLFKPMEIEDDRVTHIAETCDYITRLTQILDDDDEMFEMWAWLTETHPAIKDLIETPESDEPLFTTDENGVTQWLH